MRKAPASGAVPTPSVLTPIRASVRGMFVIIPKIPMEPVIVVASATMLSALMEIQ